MNNNKSPWNSEPSKKQVPAWMNNALFRMLGFVFGKFFALVLSLVALLSAGLVRGILEHEEKPVWKENGYIEDPVNYDEDGYRRY